MENIRVTRKLTDYRSVATLMLTAFPPEERIPIWMLNLLSKQRWENFKFVSIFFTNVIFEKKCEY